MAGLTKCFAFTWKNSNGMNEIIFIRCRGKKNAIEKMDLWCSGKVPEYQMSDNMKLIKPPTSYSGPFSVNNEYSMI